MGAILGLNAFHADSSACLLVDGRLVAAAEEERFRRIKHWAGFPSQAVAYCLESAGLSLGDLSGAFYNSDPKANLLRKAAFILIHRPEFQLVKDRVRNARKRITLEQGFRESFPGDRLRNIPRPVGHHRAHLASAFLVSPFEEAVTVSIDGFGDFASAAWGLGRGTEIRVEGHVYFPHSLGVFYEALTQYLGFRHYGDEYKVMGLAPYGQPNRIGALREVVDIRKDGRYRLNPRFFRHWNESVDYRWNQTAPVVGTLYTPDLEVLLGPARAPDHPLEERHRDIARSVQAVYEQAFFALLRSLHRIYRVDAIALAGGCAMNSVANGKITLETPFRKVYVQPAAGDAGGALGAALVASCRTGSLKSRFQMDHAYWGPEFHDADFAALIRERRAAFESAGFRITRSPDSQALCVDIAESIAQGQVVGWFQGRMEWGPRALGNRSILCDPRRGDMKAILNAKIKRRESFRPFAPSILREEVANWFEIDDDEPFMMKVFQIRAENRPRIPAVTHVDGSGRLQTVTREQNPLYYDLIRQFFALTEVPMILNISFNGLYHWIFLGAWRDGRVDWMWSHLCTGVYRLWEYKRHGIQRLGHPPTPIPVPRIQESSI